MIMFEGFHHDKHIPIIITVEFDEDSQMYEVSVVRGYDEITEVIIPKHLPQDNLMHISDLEHSVKISNNLLKKLKKLQTVRKK